MSGNYDTERVKLSVNQMIPSLWSGRILEKLRSTLVYGQGGVTNQDYAGELSQHGDVVYAHGIGDVTVSPYERNTTTLSYERLQDERREIRVTESDYFGIQLDDLDRTQMFPDVVDRVSQNAAYEMAATQDAFVANTMVAGAGATLDDAGTARAITTANAYATFVEAAQMLDERNVPEAGRFGVIPPWLASVLLQDDRFFLPASQQSVLNGGVGSIAGISLVKSNRVPVGTSVSNILIGTNMATTFVSQINRVEGMRDKDSFSDLLRGLSLYGGRVLYPECLINLRATQG